MLFSSQVDLPYLCDLTLTSLVYWSASYGFILSEAQYALLSLIRRARAPLFADKLEVADRGSF